MGGEMHTPYATISIIAVLALASCDGKGTRRARAYTGQSAHWDQGAIPISMQWRAFQHRSVL